MAILDVREQGAYARGHLLFAASLPLSRIELRIRDLVPRLTTSIVLCDIADDQSGGDLATRAAERLEALGYSDVAGLDGGMSAWKEAGYQLFGGIYVPSKAFGEVVEHHFGTPSLSPSELNALMSSGRPFLGSSTAGRPDESLGA